MKDAHAILCNDSVRFVVLDSFDNALAKMTSLKEDYYEKNKFVFNNNRKDYESMCNWHIRTVEYE